MDGTAQTQTAQPQPHTPQPVLEKTPIQSQQAVQFAHHAPAQQTHQLLPPFPPPTTESSLPFSKKWHIAKIVLGTTSLVCSIVVWALGIFMVARYGYRSSGRYSYSYSTFQVSFEAGLALGTAGLAIIWQAAEFITVWASAKNRGIHPGANVALHLIIWLASAVTVGFLALFVALDVERLAEMADGSDSSSYYYSSYYSYDPDALSGILRVEEALLAFMSILLLLHFVLFVRACVETHQYNNHTVTQTVYVQVPASMPGGIAGQQPYGYYTYQPAPGQPPMQFQQPVPQVSGAPIAPQQAHLYGYYAPAPTFPPPVPGHAQTPMMSGSSASAAGDHGARPGTVSPVTTSDRH